MQWAGRLRAIRSSIDKESKSVKAKVEAKVGAVETEVADIKAKVGAVEAKVGAVEAKIEEKLDAIMELLLRAAPAVPAAPPTESSSVERDVSAVPAPPPASSSSALQAAEPTVAGASEAPDEAPRNTKKSVMRKMSSKFSTVNRNFLLQGLRGRRDGRCTRRGVSL